ncbi:hypothetical protein A1353_19125 [Methylomonas methanica]|uniref:Uncharacterized protein n=1 Tax=Methylomonas methanica TaxID=421 RepID=A0A177M5K6_METMH|nr:hypothetical protein [Methylomonas methanica]OAI00921.1 hypothetical protein A1353_19125 [Methylomonas methanica]
MNIYVQAAALILTTAVAVPTQAQTPATTVGSAQQAARDADKLAILQAELTEQKQIVANLQQTRAVQLAANEKAELNKTESRLEEVNSNIAQLQQEIDVVQGKAMAIKTVIVKPVDAGSPNTTKPVSSGHPQASTSTGPWWDLYNRRNTSQ